MKKCVSSEDLARQPVDGAAIGLHHKPLIVDVFHLGAPSPTHCSLLFGREAEKAAHGGGQTVGIADPAQKARLFMIDNGASARHIGRDERAGLDQRPNDTQPI